MKVHCLFDKMVPTPALIPHPRNRNKHSEKQIARLAEILEYQGWRYPIKISKQSGFITSGHGRLEAAKLKTWSEVPVVYQDYESDDQEYADCVADNAIASWADLDFSGINADIKDFAPDFNLDHLGIRNFEIDVMDKNQGADEAVSEPPVEPVTKLGDIYILGDHRLVCGDSVMVSDLDRLMNGHKSKLVCTDPPYNVNIGNIKHPKFKQREILNDHMPIEDFRVFCQGWIGSIAAFNEGCIYVWGPPGPDGRVMFTELDNAFHCSTTAVWVKDSLVLGRGKYHTRYEPCWFGWNTDGNHFSEDRTLTNVWEFPRPKKSDLHPTMKPMELIEKIVREASHPGDVVLDLFGGSGTTMVACERANRRCFMMELDPRYCDVIVRRWEDATGKKATLNPA